MSTADTLTTISTCLSICGCFIIFAAHVFWNNVRSTSRKILLFITIADLFTATGYLSGQRLTETWEHGCKFQSFVTTTSSMISFFWTSCMALYLYAVSIKANSDLGKRIIFICHCVSWPVPLAISLVALLAQKLGSACHNTGTAHWCWIKEDCVSSNETRTTSQHNQTVAWMLLTGKLWEIISYIIIVFVYARIFMYVRKQRKSVESDSSSTLVARCLAVEARAIMIPKFFVFIRIWGTLRFLIFAFSGTTESDGPQFLLYLQASGDGAQGFVNAIVFCLLADKLQLFFMKCFSRKKDEQQTLLGESKSMQKDKENYPGNRL